MSNNTRELGMKVHYLEIVASDADAVCAAYAAAHNIKFGSADPLLGGARTAPLPGGGSIGVRGPLRDTEEPIVRPYWLVDDIEAALDAASKQGLSLRILRWRFRERVRSRSISREMWTTGCGNCDG